MEQNSNPNKAPMSVADRDGAHEALNAWLDHCEENPISFDDGYWHTLKLEAGLAGHDDNGPLWQITVERRYRFDL